MYNEWYCKECGWKGPETELSYIQLEEACVGDDKLVGGELHIEIGVGRHHHLLYQIVVGACDNVCSLTQLGDLSYGCRASGALELNVNVGVLFLEHRL